MTSNINIASLSASQGFFIIGANTGDHAGYSVSGAGDINGDGYDDIIIGAPYANSYAGISYVIYGSANVSNIKLSDLNLIEGFSIAGANFGDQSGKVVSGAGDVNGDGYDDVIISAPAKFWGGAAGVVYVIYGGTKLANITLSSLTTEQGFIITGPNGLGSSISGAGDVNGDGYDDIIIGASNGPYGESKTYILYGGVSLTDINVFSSLNAAKGISITDLNIGDVLGTSVGKAGNINGDLYSDVIIGAPGANSGAGVSYVIYGGSNLINIDVSSLTAEQGFYVTGVNPRDQSALSVSGAGDVNGDGFDDIIIGAPSGSNEVGAAYVIYGKMHSTNISLTLLTVEQGFSIIGTMTYGSLGYSVSGAGDINNDGYDDVIIGDLGPGDGISYVIYGGIDLNNIALSSLTTKKGITIVGGSRLGNSVSNAGDVNGDGIADIIIGAYGYSVNTGISYLIYGNSSSPASNAFPSAIPTLTPTVMTIIQNINLANLTKKQGFSIMPDLDNNGVIVSGIGDINKDGYADFIVDVKVSNNAIGYVFLGKNDSFDNINLADFNSNEGFFIRANDISSSGFVDINGDGYSDIIIGIASQYSIGRIYIVFGKKDNLSNVNLDDLKDNQGISINGMNSGDFLGVSVSGIGDINRDGYEDMIAGALFSSPQGMNLAGMSYVIFGKANNFGAINLANLARDHYGFSIAGSRALEESGFSVSGAGDFNGDGYDDIIIGVRSADIRGGIYVIFGKFANFSNLNLSTLSILEGVYITGNSVDLTFGNSVSTAGDVNGDGYDDIIIGAPGTDSSKGKSYVIFGKESISTNINVDHLTIDQGFSISGASVNDYSGCSVSGGGDINGDGYSDVIIGALWADSGDPGVDSNEGATYIIYGRSSGFENIDLSNLKNTQGFFVMGANPGDQCGSSISNVGDFNKDGYSDIVISCANHYSYGWKGISYLIFGGSSRNNTKPSLFPNTLDTVAPSIIPTLTPTVTTTIQNIDLSNLTKEQAIIISRNNGGEWNGRSVASLGDINKDGKNDIIIGIPYASNVAGVSYVIYGGINITDINLSTLSVKQGFSITGVNGGDFSGCSVDGAGDINGDGYDDIIIGAPYANSYAGISYVLYGGLTLNNIALASLTEELGFAVICDVDGLKSGFSVSSAGDMNNDGYDDIIIGANAEGLISISYVIYGQRNITDITLSVLTAEQGFSITGAVQNDLSGYSVDKVGDINNDGFDDIIIGAPNYGKSYVIYGRSNLGNVDLSILTAEQGFVITDTVSYENLGFSVAGIGDVNKDGYSDIITSAFNANGGRGISYVIYGKSNIGNIVLSELTLEQGFYISGAINNDHSGNAADGVGDINNDGFDDIIIGAPNANNYAGISYVLYGGSNLTNVALSSLNTDRGFAIKGANDGDSSGYSVAGVGDVNEDGYNDIIIGAPFASGTGVGYIIFGNHFNNILGVLPTIIPTISTKPPTANPSALTTALPSKTPTAYPSAVPSIVPTTKTPTLIPTTIPTVKFTVTPSDLSSKTPSVTPGDIPTMLPINVPSVIPSTLPTTLPSLVPNQITPLATVTPTIIPSTVPSIPSTTSNAPSNQQSDAPTVVLSTLPTMLPSLVPSQIFSQIPAVTPTTTPSTVPSIIPSDLPTINPSQIPTAAPTIPKSISTGGVYIGTSGIDYFVVESPDVNDPVTIYGNGGDDRFIIKPFEGVTVNIGDFTVGNIIDLRYFTNINSYEDLDISLTSTPTIEVKCPSGGTETIQILNTISPSVVASSDTFIFSPSNGPTVAPNSHAAKSNIDSVIITIVGALIGAIGGIGIIGFGIYCFAKHSNKASTTTLREQRNLENQNSNSKQNTANSGDVEMNNINPSLSPKTSNPNIKVVPAGYVYSTDNKVVPAGYVYSTDNKVVPVDHVYSADDKLPNTANPSSYKSVETKKSPCIVCHVHTIKFDNPEIDRIYHSRLAKFDDKPIAAKEVKKPVKLITESIARESDGERSSNAPSPTNPLIVPVLGVRNAIEYMPMVKYVADVAYPIVSAYLPELVTNFTLPSIIDNKPFLFTAHLAVGHLGAMLLPAESVTNGFVVSTAGSVAFGMRLAASHYLSEQRQNTASKDMDSFEVAKYCSATILAYTVPSIATCAMANFIMPGTECSKADIGMKISLAGAECYSMKASTKVVEEPTTADMVMPYIADSMALIASCASGGSVLSAVSSVITTDYLTRVAIDMIPTAVKEGYVDPILDNIATVYSDGVEFINKLLGASVEL
jgi:hypothetical protein